ncbi:unnamed protein product [Tilletia controversa]|nr:unnamed protein product [Tilletia controversa]
MNRAQIAAVRKKAEEECWPTAEVVNRCNFEDILFKESSSPGNEILELFLHYPPPSTSIDSREVGPLGPANELRILQLVRSQLKVRGVHQSVLHSTAAISIPPLATKILRYIRGGSNAENEAFLIDPDAIAYGRLEFPLQVSAFPLIEQYETCCKEATVIRNSGIKHDECINELNAQIRTYRAELESTSQKRDQAVSQFQEAQDRLRHQDKELARRLQQQERELEQNKNDLSTLRQEHEAGRLKVLRLQSLLEDSDSWRAAEEQLALDLQRSFGQSENTVITLREEAKVLQESLAERDGELERLRARGADIEDLHRRLTQLDRTLEVLRHQEPKMEESKEATGATRSTPSWLDEKWRTSGSRYFPKDVQVGVGAHGVVQVAEDALNGRLVALKTYRFHHDKTPSTTALREIDILTQLRSDFFITLLDVVYVTVGFSGGPELALVLDYMPSDLQAVMYDPLRRLEIVQVKMYVLQLSLGLQQLHQLGILHGDLKPSNVLVTHNHRLKIADFGLSEHVSNPHPRRVLCSLNYRAPEILLRTSHRTTASDIWSLGVIIAEFLLRHIPWDSRTPMGVMEELLNHTGCEEVLYAGADQLPGVFEGRDEDSDGDPLPFGVTRASNSILFSDFPPGKFAPAQLLLFTLVICSRQYILILWIPFSAPSGASKIVLGGIGA